MFKYPLLYFYKKVILADVNIQKRLNSMVKCNLTASSTVYIYIFIFPTLINKCNHACNSSYRSDFIDGYM